MTTDTYSLRWDLDSIFPGGSSSSELKQCLKKAKEELKKFETDVADWNQEETVFKPEVLENMLQALQSVSEKFHQMMSFVSCLQAQNTKDNIAKQLNNEITAELSDLQNATTFFYQKLSKISKQDWNHIIELGRFSELTFFLNENREEALKKLSYDQEKIINALSVDGYHAWGNVYNILVSNVRIPFKDGDDVTFLSAGQAQNKFSDPSREIRENVFKEWEKAWNDQGDLLAETLNHLAGFRLATYKERGWNGVLDEALAYNRMSKETLDSMWGVIAKMREPFQKYLHRKAKLLGLEKLSWFDVDAPISEATTTLSYQEGATFIEKHFASFSPALAHLAKTAFEDQWIEAEDRDFKRPGGFCTSFPLSEQSRIFMTYSGSASNVATLAHELGHAFHSAVMNEVHPLNQQYSMNVAETASTLAEMIVAEASLQEVENESEKLALLEDKIQRSVSLLMNIFARFLFETRFYEERKNGYVSKDRLNELMEEAQKEAFGDALDVYHPTFWASKLHFFITDVPFYNFPYTFGYLFSLGIYAKSKEEEQFEEKYIQLLQDTGSMKVENLAEKHLNVDLTNEEFWKKGVELCIKDIEVFLQMTE